MKRKIVKHGSATLTVSLPAKWAKKYGIKAGDEVDVKEEKGKLTIMTDKDVETVKECYLDLDKCGAVSRSCIGALYKGGADSIKLNFTTPAGMNAIDASLQDLLGFEIMQQQDNSCVIKEISSFGEKSELSNMLKRTFLLLISISRDSLDCLKKGNKELLDKIIERDITVNKFANYCRRIINKRGVANIREAPMVYYIIEEVENLGDEYKNLCKHLRENNIKISNKEVHKIFDSMNKLFEDFFYLYFKFKVDKVKKLSEDKKKLLSQIKKGFGTVRGVNETRLLEMFSRMTVIVGNMVGPLLTMKMPGLCEVEMK